MEQRLEAAPPASARAGRQQSIIAFDVAFMRGGMGELVEMQSLSYSPDTAKRNCRSVRALHFIDSYQLLTTLAFSDGMRKEYACLVFKRQRDDSHHTRVLVESHTDVNGCVWFILGRNDAREEVRVVVRESEEYSARLCDYVHPLKGRVVPLSAISELPERRPTFLSWREAPPQCICIARGCPSLRSGNCECAV